MAHINHSDDQNFWPGYVDTLVNMVMFLIFLIVVMAMAAMYFSIRARNEGYRQVATHSESKGKAAQQVLGADKDELPQQPTMEDMQHLIDQLKQKLYQSELRLAQNEQQEKRRLKEAEQAARENQRKGTPTADVRSRQALPSAAAQQSTLRGGRPEAVAQASPPRDEGRPGKGEVLESASAKVGSLPQGVQDFALRPNTLIVHFRPGAVDLSADEAKRFQELFSTHFGYQAGSGQSFQLTIDAVAGLSESNRMAFYRIAAVRNHLLRMEAMTAPQIKQRIDHVSPAAAKGMEALEVRITRLD